METAKITEGNITNDLAVLNNKLDSALNLIAELIGESQSVDSVETSNVIDRIENEICVANTKMDHILSALNFLNKRL